MTPSRPLPPGHFIGDGHNHGGEAGAAHDEGHVHSPNESPDEHLHHMQERQSARGQASLEEFHTAARETAALRDGRRPETARPGETTSRAREAGQSGSRGETRENTGARSSAQQSANPYSDPGKGTARYFSSLPTTNSSWQQTMASLGKTAAPPPRPAASTASAERAPESRPGPGFRQDPAGRNAPFLEHAFAQVQGALQALKLPNPDTARALPKLAEALSALVKEALRNPELLNALPPNLRKLAAQYLGQTGTIPAFAAGLSPSGVGKGGDVLLGLLWLTKMTNALQPGARHAEDNPIRGLGFLLMPAGMALPLSPKALQSGLLQRLEKSLMQFLQLLFGKNIKSGGKEELSRDELLLQQLATLLGAQEKRRRDKDKIKKKAATHQVAAPQSDLEFRDDDPDPFPVEELREGVADSSA